MTKHLTIAVDCDDVLMPSTHFIVEAYNNRYGTQVTLAKAHSSKNPEWAAPRDEVMRRLQEIQRSVEYGAIPPFPEAVEVCRQLAKDHTLHLVTARDGEVFEITKAMLDRFFPKVFSEIHHIGSSGSKGEVCTQLSAKVLIDDSIKHLAIAQKCGVPYLIWYGQYPWQQLSEDADVTRCITWQAVVEEVERIATY